MAGVDNTGFTPKTLADCKAELEAAFQAAFGSDIDLQPPSVFATLVGILAEREADLWQLAEDVYNAFNPDAAMGVVLANLAGLTGTIANPGETDAALRLRREVELRSQGNAATDAIRAKLLQVVGVTQCLVIENVADGTATVAGASMAGHSIDVVVQGGADADVRKAIFQSKAAGVQTGGTVTGTVNDAFGNPHTINFYRPTAMPVYMIPLIYKDPNVWTPALDASLKLQVQNLLLASFAAMKIGQDVVVKNLIAPLFAVPGVKDVRLYTSFSAAPTAETNLGITARQLATTDAAHLVGGVGATDYTETP
jgi:uncharacterized phage protein gp47/JayE